MIGIYDYTVWLTYFSLASAGAGIMVSLNGGGHPFMGVFFLLLCGFFDAFDGRVARTKKNRTEIEKNYGIQIDSLADLVAFGVLPACIGNAMIRVCPTMDEYIYLKAEDGHYSLQIQALFFLILIVHILATMIRLAYFNVTEEERQKSEGGVRKYYTGLPVTSASLVFPGVLLIQYIIPADITIIYFAVMLLLDILFLAKFQLRKPGFKAIIGMVAFGAVEFALLAFFWYTRNIGG